MAIDYTPQYSLLATISNVASSPLTFSGTTIAVTSIGTMPNISIEAATVSNLASVPLTVSGTTIAITNITDASGDSVLDDANDAINVNVVAGGAGDGSILDGSDTTLKASVISGTGAWINPVCVRLTDDAGAYVAPGAASHVTVSNLASVPITVSGTTIAITSLPPLGAGILSLSAGTAVTISNLASVPLTVSGTTIAITSLPPLGAGILSLSAGTAVTVSNLASVPITVSGTTIAITSLPPLGAGAVTISALASTPIVTSGTVLAIPEIVPTYFHFTSTYSSAATNSILKALPGSTTSIYLTDFIISNENTAGNARLLESPSDAAVVPIIERLYFAANGGAVCNFRTPIVLDTNSALVITTTTVTNLSVTVCGYTV